MSRSDHGARTRHGCRLPIGYRIQNREDGTLAVVLETIESPGPARLRAVHYRVLDTYKAARRSARARNREIQLSGTSSDGVTLPSRLPPRSSHAG